MSDPVRTAVQEPKVHCRRVHVQLPLSEHLSCSYCFGKEADIKTGEYEKFCDFCAGKDPVCFGFPET